MPSRSELKMQIAVQTEELAKLREQVTFQRGQIDGYNSVTRLQQKEIGELKVTWDKFQKVYAELSDRYNVLQGYARVRPSEMRTFQARSEIVRSLLDLLLGRDPVGGATQPNDEH